MNIPIKPDATAFDLLDAVRPYIEEILSQYKDLMEMPNCPSQSFRARALIDILQARMDATRTAPDRDMNVFFHLMHQRDALQKFLCIHETVCLLEWAARNYVVSI